MTPCLRACTLSARTYDTPCHFVCCYNNTSIAMRNVHARTLTPPFAGPRARVCLCVCVFLHTSMLEVNVMARAVPSKVGGMTYWFILYCEACVLVRYIGA